MVLNIKINSPVNSIKVFSMIENIRKRLSQIIEDYKVIDLIPDQVWDCDDYECIQLFIVFDHEKERMIVGDDNIDVYYPNNPLLIWPQHCMRESNFDYTARHLSEENKLSIYIYILELTHELINDLASTNNPDAILLDNNNISSVYFSQEKLTNMKDSFLNKVLSMVKSSLKKDDVIDEILYGMRNINREWLIVYNLKNNEIRYEFNKKTTPHEVFIKWDSVYTDYILSELSLKKDSATRADYAIESDHFVENNYLTDFTEQLLDDSFREYERVYVRNEINHYIVRNSVNYSGINS